MVRRAMWGYFIILENSKTATFSSSNKFKKLEKLNENVYFLKSLKEILLFCENV